MKKFQGKIEIESGKIKYLEESSGFILIILDQKEYLFENAWALTGITDSHGHIAALGSKLSGLNLDDAKSSEECVEIISDFEPNRGEWLTGNGWNQELWKEKSFPDRSILDSVFPNTPVYLSRIDGHTVWVNSKALKIAKINKFTPDISGGYIERDKSGNPTGILSDNAMELVKNNIPQYSKEQLKKNIISAFYELINNGITCVHDMDVSPSLLDIYHQLNEEGQIPVRIYSYVSGHNDEWLKYNIKPYKSEHFNIVGIKLYADGSLGSRTAAMFEPYSDHSDTKGIFLASDDELFNKSKKAIEQHFHVAIHAIGDAANKMVLKTFSKLYDNNIAEDNAVLRLEHAQHIHPDDLKYFEKHRIITSIQPIHCISDAATISQKRLGNRSNYAYPWKSLIDAGAVFISGSDFPIESHNPFTGLDALINRIPFGLKKSWHDYEKIDIDTALNSYTSEPYSAINLEGISGTLKNGDIADMIIIDRDLFNTTDIKLTKIVAVLVDGKIYQVK